MFYLYIGDTNLKYSRPDRTHIIYSLFENFGTRLKLFHYVKYVFSLFSICSKMF